MNQKLGIRKKNLVINHPLFSIRKPKGFTLIEMIVVITVIAIISSVGIASFVDYSRNQEVNKAVSDMANILQEARSRATSQVKPDVVACRNNTLSRYRVALCQTDKTQCLGINKQNYHYELQVDCEGNYTFIESGKLSTSSNISFITSDDGKVFSFPIITGGATAGSIGISGYGKPVKTITIEANGKITSN